MSRARVSEPVGMLSRAVLWARVVVLLLAIPWSFAGPRPAWAIGLAVVLGAAMSLPWLVRWGDTLRLVSRAPFVYLDMALAASVLLLAGGGGLFFSFCLTAPLLAGLLRGRFGGASAALVVAAANLLAGGGTAPAGGLDAMAAISQTAACLLAGLGGALVLDSLERAQRSSTGAWVQIRTIAAAEERRRLARELHDSVVKTLHGLRMLTATMQTEEGDRYREESSVAALERSLGVALDEARALVGDLRFEQPGEPLAGAVRRSVDAWSRRTGIAATVEVDDAAALPPGPAYELGCILRESLENVSRHAQATRVDVRLYRHRGRVELEITDDGIGFTFDGDRDNLADDGHFGLVGMLERAARVGGALHVCSSRRAGTSIRLRLPGRGRPVPSFERQGVAA